MMQNDVNMVIPSSSVRLEDEFINKLKEYNKNNKMNTMEKTEYRERIGKLYDDIGDIEPIENEINNIVYFDNYDEVGLVINKDISSFKQTWTEYRLMYNERDKKENVIMENSFVLDNFDELYERISQRVDGLDKYISDLNSLKSKAIYDNKLLKDDRENFEIEKVTFENYRNEETVRLEMLEKELNSKLEKINSLITLFEDKIKSLE